MNYSKHYDILIERARLRITDSYTEKHHIIPRCLGGSNKKENIVSLTAREHYIAHQLLVKMNPNHHGLIKAAAMMACGNTVTRRCNNRLYEWLRIKHSKVMSESQSGSGNSQYGTCWVSDVENEVTKKIKKLELPKYIKAGWVKGRNKKKINCIHCNTLFVPATTEKSCSTSCLDQFRSNLSKQSQPKIQAALAERYGKDYRSILGRKGGLVKQ